MIERIQAIKESLAILDREIQAKMEVRNQLRHELFGLEVANFPYNVGDEVTFSNCGPRKIVRIHSNSAGVFVYYAVPLKSGNWSKVAKCLNAKSFLKMIGRAES